LEIPSVLTKYNFNTASSTDSKLEIPGNVVFDYMPLHPALSNPKSLHRYHLSLWKQPTSTYLTINKSEWSKTASQERLKSQSLPPHQRLNESSREVELEIRERSLPLPTMAFATKYGLRLSGLSLFTSTFNINTPSVYHALGLHQPVYGTIKEETVEHLLRKLENAQEAARNGIEALDSTELKKLNHGYKNVLPQPRLPTRRDLRVPTLGVKSEVPVSDSIRKANGRLKRLTVFGAVGLIKNDKNDFASGFRGELLRKFRDANEGYLNA
jgi:hypothetical protein